MRHERILLEHGSGGLLSHELITEVFLPLLRNPHLERLEDSAVLTVGERSICFTTDSYVIDPLFFPGGDIGSLAVHGTVNDLAVCGGRPLFISAGFIIEEGLPLEDLRRITLSMAEAARKAGVAVVTGDTKVVARGAADGLFINTSGIGLVEYPHPLSVKSIEAGDAVIVSGTVGDHGAAVLSRRRELGVISEVLSDSAPLNGLIAAILAASPRVHCMRDPTRGGLGAILAEIAKQSGRLIEIREKDVPVREEVRGICEILGFDPLFLANEGKVVVFCHPGDADRVLEVMRGHEYGREAALIGSVGERERGRLVLRTVIGSSREVDLPVGELVPRIC
ncbi:MAG TPA: hydrogenase expression/formation protein HypE [Syntrophales bacterium]|nr:hydrogenase expression/formation protein HypE [Syntrophales bacterium]HOM06613.1 hydrogenase expression/formation protein HypE [Syntrophales bacterium]HPC01117.1 hydrogenase expression/formation protein HypE [Syntrophales bacterium]HPQ06274.1 hydrogenase expression/formation protein HypE [Syntrophales bacterium]HRV42575.1 hydrogenase expression/formation protein HypE [Syntrophales bacterium]